MQRIQHQHRESAWSKPSSMSPDYHEDQGRAQRFDTPPDISPASTPPRSYHDHSFEDAPVSPIEPALPVRTRSPLTSYEYPSRIPLRVPSADQGVDQEAAKEKSETRWDAYSGEPTKDESGLPPTVRPGVQPLEFQYPQLKERTKQILAGIREREAAANRPTWLKQQPLEQVPDPLDGGIRKEPWKGASGRTALVDPVRTVVPARKALNHAPQHTIVRKELPDIVTRPESPAHSLRSMTSEESIEPVAPLKITTKSQSTSPQSSVQSLSSPVADVIHSAPPVYQNPKTLQSPFSSPGPSRFTEAPLLSSEMRAESPPADATPRTPRTPTPPGQYGSDTPIKVEQTPSEPDVSRFSWTTYATSVTESPGSTARIIRSESPPPPVPKVPQIHIRKRPVSDVHSESLFMNRDSRPSQGSAVIRKPIGSKPRASSATLGSRLSLSKSLPQVPPELEATDKISNLEAQLDGLAMRRHNITRIVRDLNSSLQKNAIVYDIWKRKEVAHRISNQEDELQNIANEEHDIALRLHRALKKRDKENYYELPTGLWIKRVTS